MNHDVVLYVSDNNEHCTQVLDLVKQYDVSYQVKNVSQHKEYMQEMQKNGVYGTPALFIKGERNSILGYQKQRICNALKNAESSG